MRYRFLRFPGGRPKAVTLSYDDGVRQDLRLAEICNQYGLKCTFNINSAFLPQEPGGGKLTAGEIRENLLSAGHEVAVHGHRHRAPGICRPIDAIQDILTCRLELERLFGGIIRGMAYPDTGITRWHNGASYETVRRNLQDLGIVYSRTLGGDNNGFLLPQDWYAWMPTAHHNNPLVLDYAREFAGFEDSSAYSAHRYPRLFYLWGHSYEFDNDGNWDRLEDICRILAGRDDTWYATNIAIREYVNAYESLICSADGTVVYNPTLTEVWFDQDEVLFSVAPGQTVTLK